MLLRLLLITVLATSIRVFGQDINQLRDFYIQAGKDREKTSAFVNLFTDKLKNSDALFLAYNGTALAMHADVVKGKYTKYKTFVAGRDKIEAAIKGDKLNPEIRFLRFSVQSNLPAFLNYDNREEDKEILLKSFSALSKINNTEFVSIIFNTLLASEILTDSEKIKLNNQIKQMQKK